ncbi:MAG: GntR family transcriptional regulator [Planctomycetota bacterium]|nr:GntR family transcriptional regulator [Planctomycetota bacterium]
MALWIQISAGSNEPIYMQIVSQISEAIAKGEISAGQKLPAMRKLAAELVINPNTVARAYSELEQAGLITTKTGSGTFVNDPKLRTIDAANINILAERMDSIVARGINLGINASDLAAMFRGRVDSFINKSQKREKENERDST